MFNFIRTSSMNAVAMLAQFSFSDILQEKCTYFPEGGTFSPGDFNHSEDWSRENGQGRNYPASANRPVWIFIFALIIGWVFVVYKRKYPDCLRVNVKLKN